MLEVPVYNTDGKEVDTLKVDENTFGGEVNVSLLKQVVVAHHANSRQGTAATKSRSMSAGSTRKLFRQKGTGNARRGGIRSNIVRGGGVAFAKGHSNFRKILPRKMRKAALGSAILAKILGHDLLVVEGLQADEPKTSRMAGVLKNLNIDRSCLLALPERDRDLYLSCRNIPRLTVRTTSDLNAAEVVIRQKLLVTAEAMKALLGGENAS